MSDAELVGYRTTLAGMFGAEASGLPRVERVEIPLIQRDYAQGRTDPRTSAIRARFLDALHAALTGDAAVGLDFVYGEVREGVFEPLDGQQRLTTLFLLHWYLASRCGALDESQAWTRFSYATRPSARLFCERLAKHSLPKDLNGPPSGWVRDQSWYLHLWRFDPSIRGMLVTLDAIAARFAGEAAEPLWSRLTDDAQPAVWFQLLPIAGMGGAEDLYIKMNSRGKPLTDFEAFKAHLGRLVAEVGGAEDFGQRIDGTWTDVLWPYRGDDDIVDDEVMRYFDFLLEVCEWREGQVRGEQVTTLEQRASALLEKGNPRRQEHLGFVCAAFDTWVAERPATFLAGHFTAAADGQGLRLFGADSVDLFEGCCRRYAAPQGGTRPFSLTDTLLLFAVLVHRLEGTADAPARLRSLRNANEASQFEVRVQNMPKLVAEVEAFMRSGDLAALTTYNQNQVADEALKRELLLRHPGLAPATARLEDHTVLRGTLAAFELDDMLPGRAEAFWAALEPQHWLALTGALLATGEYQRDLPDYDQHRFGSPTTEGVWRAMLVDRGDRASLARVREVLGRLLDRVATSDLDVASTLETVVQEFVQERTEASRYDWRYHLVRYPQMREGNSGIYYGAGGRLGYELTMLRRTVQRSWYRDAYLYAIWCEAGRPDEVVDPWFYGYSSAERWMTLSRSGTSMRSVQAGLAIRGSTATDAALALEAACVAAGAEQRDRGWLLAMEQADWDGELVDTEDRVQRGAGFLKELIAFGL